MILTAEVVARCQRHMSILASRYARHGIETDDLISSAWLRVCQHIHEYDLERSSLETFIHRHAEWAMQEMSRKGLRYSAPPEFTELIDIPTRGRSIDVQVDAERAMSHPDLTEPERTTLRHYFFEDLTFKEAGEKQGFGRARAHQLVSSALGVLRAAYA